MQPTSKERAHAHRAKAGRAVTRLNLILVLALVGCALAAVTSQHNARKLFVELEKGREAARQLDVEWGQLQLEQSTWATHSRVERIAGGALRMRVPDAKHIAVVAPAAAGAREQ